MASLMAPVFASFQQQYPAVMIRYLTDMRLFRLDYGEAHVAIRAGSAPQEPDNVVMPFVQMRAALYASRSYIETYGQPQTEADLAQHRFVYTDTSGNRAPFYKWLADRVPEDRLTFRVSLPDDSLTAVKAGLGLGFVPVYEAKQHADLVQVLAPIPDWQAPLWLVTHVDLHRTLKVQSFLSHLKAAAADWGDL
jgi:DNA-binding transcriptional LysR family regulator